MKFRFSIKTIIFFSQTGIVGRKERKKKDNFIACHPGYPGSFLLKKFKKMHLVWDNFFPF